MNTKHTKGPWIVSSRYVPVTLNNNPDQRPQFDSVEVKGRDSGGGIALVHRKPGHGNPNARLIAAAPDLLAALEKIVAQIDPKDTKEIGLGNYLNARAALAKAIA